MKPHFLRKTKTNSSAQEADVNSLPKIWYWNTLISSRATKTNIFHEPVVGLALTGKFIGYIGYYCGAW